MEQRVEADSTTQMIESDSLSLGQHDEMLAASAAGRFTSAQVVFRGPDTWILPTIFVRLFGRSGGGRLLLAEVALSSTSPTLEEGLSTALVIAVRGIHVEGFEVVVAQDDEEGEAVTGGHILLIVSAAGDAPDIRPDLPSPLQPRVAQGAPAAQAGRWPVFLSDGSAELGATANALHVQKSEVGSSGFGMGTGGSTRAKWSRTEAWP